MADKVTAIRKRQKIQDSNKAMFAWVAGMSAVVGLCLVASWFLWEQISFKQQLVNAKNETVEQLKENNEAIPKLRDNIRVLETDRSLNEAKAREEDKALQVILDALPSEGNSLALGASLQESLANGISGLNVESLTVEPSAEEMGNRSNPNKQTGQIVFRLEVTSSNVNALRSLLQRFERSIRVIDIDDLRLERSSDNCTMVIVAHAYYEPARVVELKEERLRL